MMDGIAQFFAGLPARVKQDGDEFQVNDGLSFVADGRRCDPADRKKATVMANRNRQVAAANDGRRMFFFRLEDWEAAEVPIQHWIAHKIGLAVAYCSARQCAKKEIDRSIAAAFYREHHLQADAGGRHFALLLDDNPVAVMTFSRCSQGRNGAMEPGVQTLARYAVAGGVPGAASRLFRFAVEQTNASRVVTFSDNGYASGEVYRVLGFKQHGESPPDYRVWHPSLGLMHKAAWQRKLIPTRMADLGVDGVFDPNTDTRTEAKMEKELGCMLAWDCGKTRWLWCR